MSDVIEKIIPKLKRDYVVTMVRSRDTALSFSGEDGNVKIYTAVTQNMISGTFRFLYHLLRNFP